ncbi:AAA family ATPase [Candidatus Desantisbacteria bacterium]|nr:AAA family ATPase [Candidatus Desantisbacteria bacterium]
MHQILEKVYYEIKNPKIKMEDIGGHSKIKIKLLEKLKSNDRILLWGPKGIGVPMLAEAYAYEKKRNFLFLCIHKVFEIDENVKKNFLDKIFLTAKEEAPVVLYISDLEWIAPAPNSVYEWEQGNFKGKPKKLAHPELSSEFLNVLKEIIKIPDICFIGSSYKIDTVNSDVLSLFDCKLFVNPPDFNDRKEIFDIYLQKFEIKDRLSNEITSGWLAEISSGLVGNDIQAVCKQVLVQAFKYNVKILTPSIFQIVLKNYTPYLTKTMIETYFKLAEKAW